MQSVRDVALGLLLLDGDTGRGSPGTERELLMRRKGLIDLKPFSMCQSRRHFDGGTKCNKICVHCCGLIVTSSDETNIRCDQKLPRLFLFEIN